MMECSCRFSVWQKSSKAAALKEQKKNSCRTLSNHFTSKRIVVWHACFKRTIDSRCQVVDSESTSNIDFHLITHCKKLMTEFKKESCESSDLLTSHTVNISAVQYLTQ